MSTDTSSKQARLEEINTVVGRLPNSYNGWMRYEDEAAEKEVFTYWRARSTHAGSGGYERLRAYRREHTHAEHQDPDITLTKTTMDQFGHNVGLQPTVATYAVGEGDRIWESAQDHMDDYPGDGSFESPPAIPTQIGEWELMTKGFSPERETSRRVTKWERGFGEAELTVEETDIIPQYQSTRYEYAVRYREIDMTESVDIVTDVPRTQAFEIGVHVLRQLDVPVGDCRARQAALQHIKGIGPAKSRKLLLLGLTTPDAVAEHVGRDGSSRLSGNKPLVNRHHSAAVDTVLTSTIRESVSVGGDSNLNPDGGD